MARVLTVGHSTMSSADLVDLLRAHGVAIVADVRRYPGSRRHPQFGRDRLAGTLRAAGIAYEHIEELGGRRAPVPGSLTAGIRDEQLRGYADHMATAAFARGVRVLLALADAGTVAVMCAEGAPERCHRSMLADALSLQGVEVEHVVGTGERRAHRPPPEVRLVDGVPRYDAAAQGELPLDA
jgi:uncharacterized protein (DUF488 family)